MPDRMCFVVDHYDPLASLVRKYQLIYYSADKTIEMVRSTRCQQAACAGADAAASSGQATPAPPASGAARLLLLPQGVLLPNASDR